MTLYEQLKTRKKNGEVIKLRDLDKKELYQLYVVENVLDSNIAELCECTKKAVRNKRQKLQVVDKCKTILLIANVLKQYNEK